MAELTRKGSLGRGLNSLLAETKEKEIAVLKTENDFLRQQLKDCQEQLAYMQKIFAMKMQ